MPRCEPKPAPDFAVDFLADWRTVRTAGELTTRRQYS